MIRGEVMKTVQQVLRELDTERLIAYYLWENPIGYDRYEDWLDLTVREIRDAYRKRLTDYIQRLREMKITEPENGHQGVLFVHRVMEEYFSEEYRLVHLDELIKMGSKCENYMYGFAKQSEIVGFLVADTPLTKRHIYDLMSDVLYQASYFGYEQEYLQEEMGKLTVSLENDQNRPSEAVPEEDLKEKWHEEYEIDFVCDPPDVKELRDLAVKAETEYGKCSRDYELTLIRNAYLSENGGLNYV